MTPTVITLRARSCRTTPRAGELMAAETGPAVYRIETVTTLRQAGEKPGAHRYRLTCTRPAPKVTRSRNPSMAVGGLARRRARRRHRPLL